MIAKYDPKKFTVELLSLIPARLGTFRLGASRLGRYVAGYVPIPMASFTYSCDYSPNADNTLIIGSEQASVAIAYKHDIAASSAPLFPSDRVRVRYGNAVVFRGTVDTTQITRTPVDRRQYGYSVQTDFSATLVGTYAATLSRKVTYGSLPAEPALTRIRRWVKVTNWDGTVYNPVVKAV